MSRRRDRHYNPFEEDPEPAVSRRREARLVPEDADPAEMGEVLAALEGLAAEQALQLMRQRGFAPLESALDAMKQAAAWGDAWDLDAAHLEFHATLFELCGNRILTATWNGSQRLFRSVVHLDRNAASPSAVDEHLDLLNMARRAAPEAARLEFEQHARAHFPPVTRRLQPRYHEPTFMEDDDDI